MLNAYLMIGLLEVKSKEVRHVNVPFYEALTIKKIADFLENGHQHVFDYFPDQ